MAQENIQTFNLSELEEYLNQPIPPFELAIEHMNLYVMPVIIFIGLVGNTISFIVFVGTHLKHQSSSVYLAFLNIADNLFLISLCIGVWFGWVRVFIIHVSGICQIVVYLTYVSTFLSVWTIVAFTVERYIVVFHPFKRHQFCTKKRAIRVMCCLTAGSFLIYTFALWTNGVHVIHEVRLCVPHPKYKAAIDVITIVDTIVTFAVPSVLIVAFNCAIAIKIAQFLFNRNNYLMEHNTSDNIVNNETRQRQTNLDQCDGNDQIIVENNDGESGHVSSGPRSKCSTSSGSSTSEKTVKNTCVYNNLMIVTNVRTRTRTMQLRTTRSLLIISTTFVMLNLPSHAIRLYALTSDFSHSRPPLKVLLMQQLFQMLSYSNFSLNIFLYCACSQQFRKGFMSLIQKCYQKAKCC